MHEGRYFSHDELKCRCCGKNLMHPEFLDRLDQLRERVGPLPVSSAYRCPDHNSRVSGTSADGPHTTGRAIDLRVSGAKAYAVVQEALLLGFTGIGVSQKGPHGSRFIHLDDLHGSTRPWVWSY